MILYRIYQLFVAAPILLLLTILTALATILGCTIGNASFWSYYPGMLWSRAMIRLLLLPVNIEGKENMDANQSYVIVANHQGAFDIFLIYGFLGRHFKWVMKSSLRNIPLVGRACEAADFIFIDKHPARIKESHDRARRILKGGVSVVVFPEGKRTWTGDMNAFKRGAFQMADELQLPVLPVTINGSFKVLPRKYDIYFVNRHRLSLTIHAPIQPKGKGVEAEHAVMDEAYNTIKSALETT
ncbi:MAG: 1-acyl-sn-glycerol-3-phosphate acyltransferase [Bacteroidaceae bacterium]|nr:1-acyl-sn-glycerol-3-phosphate acyltransferase [Bacteroidaceae bacterium]